MTAYAVNCYTCLVNVWQGNELIEPDGQTLLTAYADSTPGDVCPSKVEQCPNKSAAIEEGRLRRPAFVADVERLIRRIDEVRANREVTAWRLATTTDRVSKFEERATLIEEKVTRLEGKVPPDRP